MTAQRFPAQLPIAIAATTGRVLSKVFITPANEALVSISGEPRMVPAGIRQSAPGWNLSPVTTR